MSDDPPEPEQPACAATAERPVDQVELRIIIRADGQVAIYGPIDNLPICTQILVSGTIALAQHHAGKTTPDASSSLPPRIVVPKFNLPFAKTN